ncbi:MAG: hypothetical protein A2047_00945 [Omnitrophica bacterium GWA2_41_15]|nr:MAG: hypothetical protein A2047_00945 [Omnitrophica bacterium GWA2_41_15]
MIPDEIDKWKDESRTLANEMINFARNYNCTKCSEMHCSHMLIDRRQKFGKKVEKQLEDLIKLNSQPLLAE